jgi:hypothetical protein
MIHLQITDSTMRAVGTFGLIGDSDIQPLTIGIMIGIVLITGILVDRWLNRNQDNNE